MDNYFTYTRLLGLNDSNLPPFKESRVKRYESVQKMLKLINVAKSLMPSVPNALFSLDPYDPEWDDLMPFPTIDRKKYAFAGLSVGGLLYFYSYNYNTFTNNIRLRTFRNLFPVCLVLYFGYFYSEYRKQIVKINLFDEYCWLRTQELVKQNEYLLQHEDVKKVVWWEQDFKETMSKVYRQANNHHASDFADSELLIQDFINRYVDPALVSPMKNFKAVI